MKVVNVEGACLNAPRLDIVCVVSLRLETLPAVPGDVLANGILGGMPLNRGTRRLECHRDVGSQRQLMAACCLPQRRMALDSTNERCGHGSHGRNGTTLKTL